MRLYSQHEINYSSEYVGVCLHSKLTGKYVSYISHKKQYTIGLFVLAADGAYARDKCLSKLGKSYKPNFLNESEYIAARNQELSTRSLEVSLDKVLKYMNSRAKELMLSIKGIKKKVKLTTDRIDKRCVMSSCY